MKKIGILAIALFAGVAAMAQESVVKEAEHILKGSSPDYAAALKAIQPALTDPSTAEQMNTWYVAGKAAMGIYDEAYKKQAMGQEVPADQLKQAGQALYDSYKYYRKAMTLDSIPDAKGKIKPKKTKEMLSNIAGHYGDFLNAGLFLYNTQDYPAAYEAWNVYTTLPENPIFNGKAPVAQPDSVVGQILFYQGTAALLSKEYKQAMDAYSKAIDKNYTPVEVYLYGGEAARLAEDENALLDFCKKGYEKYGTQDAQFIGQLINHELEKSNFDNAFKLVDEALAKTDPTSPMYSQLLTIRGIVNEQNNNIDAAKADFEKSVAVDPSNAKSHFGLGRLRFNAALTASNSIDTALPQELKDQFLAAIDELKAAYNLDNTLTQIPAVIFQAYYILGAGYEEDAKEWQSIAGIQL